MLSLLLLDASRPAAAERGSVTESWSPGSWAVGSRDVVKVDNTNGVERVANWPTFVGSFATNHASSTELLWSEHLPKNWLNGAALLRSHEYIITGGNWHLPPYPFWVAGGSVETNAY